MLIYLLVPLISSSLAGNVLTTGKKKVSGNFHRTLELSDDFPQVPVEGFESKCLICKTEDAQEQLSPCLCKTCKKCSMKKSLETCAVCNEATIMKRWQIQSS